LSDDIASESFRDLEVAAVHHRVDAIAELIGRDPASGHFGQLVEILGHLADDADERLAELVAIAQVAHHLLDIELGDLRRQLHRHAGARCQEDCRYHGSSPRTHRR